jgi:uncharacterized protein YdiU (UPF0061 family)
VKRFKSHHWFGYFFDKSMVLAQIVSWLRRYIARVQDDKTDDIRRKEAMNSVNPKYVLRNYLAQLAIDKAEQGDNSMVNELLEVLRHPYDEQPEHQTWAEKRPARMDDVCFQEPKVTQQ